jgi:hypothetical protein
LGFDEQITKIFPRRRTILQFSQIRLMLERTFIANSSTRYHRNSFLDNGLWESMRCPAAGRKPGVYVLNVKSSSVPPTS